MPIGVRRFEKFIKIQIMVHKNDQPLKKAVVLLSGGIDSTTTLAIARSAGFIIYALSFRYGQRHLVELEAAKQIALNNTV